MHRVTRPIFFGLLVLYGCATTFVPLADSLLETAAASHVDHLEEIARPCSVGHDELTCPLCQYVGLPSLVSATQNQLGLRNTQLLSNAIAEASPQITSFFSPLGPRGPPPA